MVAVRFMGWSLLLLAGSLSLGCNEDRFPARAAGSPAPPEAARASSAPAAEVPPLFEVTPAAAQEVRRILAEQGMGACYLRLRAVPGGCCGFQHKLDLDPAVSAEDHIFESRGLKVVVFKRQMEMLRGSRVDFVQEKDTRGFKVDNPNFEGESAAKWLRMLEQEKDRH